MLMNYSYISGISSYSAAKHYDTFPNLIPVVKRILGYLARQKIQYIKDYDLEIILSFEDESLDNWNLTLRSYFLSSTAGTVFSINRKANTNKSSTGYIVYETNHTNQNMFEALENHILYIYDSDDTTYLAKSVDEGFRLIIDIGNSLENELTATSPGEDHEFNSFVEWAVVEIINYLFFIYPENKELFFSLYHSENRLLERLSVILESETEFLYDTIFEYMRSN